MSQIQYVTDQSGKPLYVQIPVDEYERLLAEAESADDVAAYLEAKRNAGRTLSFDEAFAEIDAHHGQRNG